MDIYVPKAENQDTSMTQQKLHNSSIKNSIQDIFKSKVLLNLQWKNLVDLKINFEHLYYLAKGFFEDFTCKNETKDTKCAVWQFKALTIY